MILSNATKVPPMICVCFTLVTIQNKDIFEIPIDAVSDLLQLLKTEIKSFRKVCQSHTLIPFQTLSRNLSSTMTWMKLSFRYSSEAVRTLLAGAYQIPQYPTGPCQPLHLNYECRNIEQYKLLSTRYLEMLSYLLVLVDVCSF